MMADNNKYSTLQKLRRSARYKKWRLNVFRRDNFTCQRCGVVGGYLNAHHIKSFYRYKKLRFLLSNGITLCKNCHNKFHAIYGISSFSAKDLKEFLNNE